MFILSDSPPEKDVQWSDEGIVSSHKFIQKLWVLNSKIIEQTKNDYKEDSDEEIIKYTNKFIKKVTENLENFSYNKIIANLYEMYSFFSKQIKNKYTKKTIIENYEKILISMLPIIPHFASECITMINGDKKVSWPKYNEDLFTKDDVTIVIQINGKKRGVIISPKNTTEDSLLEKIVYDEKLNKYLQNKKINKKIFIKDRLINIIL